MVRGKTTASCILPFEGGAHQASVTGSSHWVRASSCGAESRTSGQDGVLNNDQSHPFGVQVGSHFESVGDERYKSTPVPKPGLNQLI